VIIFLSAPTLSVLREGKRGGRGKGDANLFYVKKEERRAGKPSKRRSMELVATELAKRLEMQIQTMRSGDRSWAVSRARTMAVYVLVHRVGCSLSDVAAYFNRDMATVGTLLARFSDRMQSDEKLRWEINRLARIVES